MCPQVFESPPEQGALLPLPELSACLPGVMPDKNGNFEESICRDKRLDAYSKTKLYQSFGRSPRQPCKPKRSLRHDIRRSSSRGFVSPTNSSFQKRFAGQLVKSRDRGQSAVETCNSKNSIGPNFFSYHEGQFCDMATRRLYPRCEVENSTECFDE